jgi:hypothetical protein
MNGGNGAHITAAPMHMVHFCDSAIKQALTVNHDCTSSGKDCLYQLLDRVWQTFASSDRGRSK